MTAARNEKTGSPKCTGKRVWVRLEKNPTALNELRPSVHPRAHEHFCGGASTSARKKFRCSSSPAGGPRQCDFCCLRHVRKMCRVVPQIRHLVRNDQMMLVVNGSLRVVADHAGAAAAGRHRSAIGVGQ